MDVLMFVRWGLAIFPKFCDFLVELQSSFLMLPCYLISPPSIRNQILHPYLLDFPWLKMSPRRHQSEHICIFVDPESDVLTSFQTLLNLSLCLFLIFSFFLHNSCHVNLSNCSTSKFIYLFQILFVSPCTHFV